MRKSNTTNTLLSTLSSTSPTKSIDSLSNNNIDGFNGNSHDKNTYNNKIKNSSSSNSSNNSSRGSNDGSTISITTNKTNRSACTIPSTKSIQSGIATKKSNKMELEIETILEKAKFYTSLCLGTTAILSVFTFLFLIPFVVDPAISTIIADYDPVPVTCIVIDHIYAEGIKNCTWSSCREGCTSSPNKCHQLYVNYTRIPFDEWKKRPRNLHSINWDVSYTKFLINSEGCGYPPTTNCSVFAKQYGYSHIGEPFPCYYSRAYPEVVIGRYSWENNLYHLILSLVIPTVLFAISIGVLSYWYCPCCDHACNRSRRIYVEKFPTKEEISNCMKCNPDKTISLNSS